MGIFFAFTALMCWGLGDFLIQRSSREFGKWVTLFFITACASIVLAPFIYKEVGAVFANNYELIILIIASVTMCLAGLFDFQALKVGKICVVAPIYALEIPVTGALAGLVLREILNWQQIALIAALFVGIFLVSTKHIHHLKKMHLEKGVWFAVLGAIGMGATNFMFGVGSRATSPLMVNWFTSTVVALITLVWLAFHSREKEIFKDWKKDKLLILITGFSDNLAWIAYAYSLLYIPIAVATGISESYVALAALLGVIFNKEKLNRHQIVGLVLAAMAAVALAMITPD